jgi:hypothetical protein
VTALLFRRKKRSSLTRRKYNQDVSVPLWIDELVVALAADLPPEKSVVLGEVCGESNDRKAF